MTRALGLVFLTLGLTFCVACGGAQIPSHNGYKGKKPRPWEKAKVLKLDKNEAKADVDLDYAKLKRAKWLAVDLPGPGTLTAQIEVSPSSGSGGTTEEGEELDIDVGFELLDGNSFNILAASNLESDDAHELKKELKAKELTEGRYLIHVYLQGRLDAADIDVKVNFERGQVAWKSDFPNQVAFVGPLAAIPPLDDAPEQVAVKKKTRVTRVTSDKPKDKDKPDDDKSSGGGAVMAEISDTQPEGSGGTIITIAAGTGDGLENGLSGSVKGVRNSGFKLSGCGASTCRAKVKAAIDDVRSAGAVIVKLKAP
ncbi:MAG TPA: hypothetical protein VM261_17875 [Kofleriaceae bacterium]|nr:hypothetical protein [Kofleriaceae bacterium]